VIGLSTIDWNEFHGYSNFTSQKQWAFIDFISKTRSFELQPDLDRHLRVAPETFRSIEM